MNDLSRTLILCSALMLTACAEDDPQKFIEEGNALFEKGSVKEARVQFKNAIQLNPQLSEAYYGLALLDEAKNEYSSMRQNLLDVIRLDPNHIDAHVKLGLLLLDDLDKAKEQAAIALKLDPENNDAIILHARNQYNEGKYKESVESADKVLAKDPSKIEAYWSKAQALRAQKKYEQALKAVTLGMAQKNDNIDLGLLKIKIYKDQQNISKALQVYDELIAQYPDDKQVRLFKINTLLHGGESELIKKAFQQTISDFNDDGLKTILIDYLLKTGQVEQAQKQLEAFLASDAQNIKLKARLAKLYLQQGKAEDAKKILEEIMVAEPTGQEGLSAKLLMAKIMMAEKAPEKAAKMVEEIIATDNANTGALMYRAELRLNQKRFDDAISDLRIVLRDQPKNDRSMVMMAQIYQLKGEPEVADSYWRKALEVNASNISALNPLVSKRIKNGDVQSAEGLIRKALKVSPKNQTLVEMLFNVKIIENDWKEAEDILKQLPQESVNTQMLTARLLISQKKYPDAIKVYQTLLTKTPKANAALSGLYRTYLQVGQSEQLITYLESFQQQYPENIYAKILLGQTYGLNKQWAHAENVLYEVLNLNSKSLNAYVLLNGIYIKQGEKNKSLALLKKGLKEIPGNPQLLLEQATYYEEAKDYEKAKNIYEQILEQTPDNPVVINNLATLILDTKTDSVNIQKALKLAERIKSINNPYFQDTYAWALCKSGDYKNAIIVLKKVATVLPNNQDIKQHLDSAQKTACSVEVALKGG